MAPRLLERAARVGHSEPTHTAAVGLVVALARSPEVQVEQAALGIWRRSQRGIDRMYIILIVLLLLLLVGGLPTWGYHNYGYFPSGGLGLILLVLVILALAGRL